MNTISTIKSSIIVAVSSLLMLACSSDSYSDDNSSSNSVTVNERAGSQNTDPYGEGGSGSENNGDSPEDNNSSFNFTVTNNGASSYIFNNIDLDNEENPDLVLKRGNTYTFNINAPGHPFLIKTVQGASNADIYDVGISNNGVDNGTITIEITADTPDTLYYNCEFHGSMTGVLTIED